MEINRFEDVIGVRVVEEIVEGRFVCLTSHNLGGDLMNVDADVPGAKLPTSAEEAKRARYCITFAVDNRPTPIVDWPSTPVDFRGGFVNSTAGPLTGVKMWLTHPGNQENQAIPSGYKAIVFTEAYVTIPSGQYVYSAGLEVPGAAVEIETGAGADRGKPKELAAFDSDTAVARVIDYDASTGALTIKVND